MYTLEQQAEISPLSSEISPLLLSGYFIRAAGKETKTRRHWASLFVLLDVATWFLPLHVCIFANLWVAQPGLFGHLGPYLTMTKGDRYKMKV